MTLKSMLQTDYEEYCSTTFASGLNVQANEDKNLLLQSDVQSFLDKFPMGYALHH